MIFSSLKRSLCVIRTDHRHGRSANSTGAAIVTEKIHRMSQSRQIPETIQTTQPVQRPGFRHIGFEVSFLKCRLATLYQTAVIYHVSAGSQRAEQPARMPRTETNGCSRRPYPPTCLRQKGVDEAQRKQADEKRQRKHQRLRQKNTSDTSTKLRVHR